MTTSKDWPSREMVKYLTVEEVIATHDHAIREFGGSPELASVARLESAVATPRQTMFGQDLYPDLFSKAAILIYLLIKNHPFVDGNKMRPTRLVMSWTSDWKADSRAPTYRLPTT